MVLIVLLACLLAFGLFHSNTPERLILTRFAVRFAKGVRKTGTPRTPRDHNPILQGPLQGDTKANISRNPCAATPHRPFCAQKTYRAHLSVTGSLGRNGPFNTSASGITRRSAGRNLRRGFRARRHSGGAISACIGGCNIFGGTL